LSINLERYKSNNFSEDCHEFQNISRELINFDNVRKDLWAQLRSVDAYDEAKKTLIEIIDITHYSSSLSINELFIEMRQKIFESLVLLINEDHIKIDFNNREKYYFKFKLVFCHGEKENIKAYEHLRLKIDSILRPFGYAFISLDL